MQRIFDILFSVLALLVFLPLLVPIALILRFTGEGEVFFLQSRVGRAGKPFQLYKFATMLKESPNIGTGTVTLRDDPRILPVGRFLRKTKVNELPQLINILKGDMSVVGPRPQAQRCFDAFPLSTKKSIIQVRPGLSGIGSIIFRSEEDILSKSEVDTLAYYDKVVAPYKGELEEWYVENKSITAYFLVILITLVVIFCSRSSLVWRIFPEIPSPPSELHSALNYKKSNLIAFFRWTFIAACIGVVVASLLPSGSVAAIESFAMWDKAQHALWFAVLTLLGNLSFPARTMHLLLGLFLMGGIIEIIQEATGWRSGEVLDMAANATGIFLVYGISQLRTVGNQE